MPIDVAVISVLKNPWNAFKKILPGQKSESNSRSVLKTTQSLFLFFGISFTLIFISEVGQRVQPTSDKLISITAAVVIIALMAAYRWKPQQPLATDVVLTAAIAASAFGVPSGKEAWGSLAGLIYSVMTYFALFGPRRRVLGRFFVFCCGYAVALSVVNLFNGSFVFEVIRQFIPVFMIHLMAAAMGRHEQNARRQRSLATSTAAMVSVVEQHDLEVTTLEIALQLLTDSQQTNAVAAFLTTTSNGLEVCQAKGKQSESLLGKTLAIEPDPLNASIRFKNPFPGFSDALGVPLWVKGTLFGVVVVCTPTKFDNDLSPTLETLGGQAVLTMERLATEGRFRSLVAHSADLLAILNSDGTAEYLSPAFHQLTGRATSEAIGSNLFQIFHPEDIENLKNSLKTGGISQVQLRWNHLDGSWPITEVTVSELNDESNKKRWILNVRDVSERAELEIQLRHSQKLEAIGRLAGGMAHEINTPIQFMNSNLHFIIESLESVAELIGQYRQELSTADESATQRVREQEESVDIDFLLDELPTSANEVLNGAARVASIVAAMKSFGEADNTKMGPANLNELIREAAVIAQVEIGDIADIEFNLQDIPSVPCFVGDVNQVLLHLLINASHAIVDAGPAKGTITVSTSIDERYATIAVSDTGCGIPENIAARVFDPFFTTKEVGRGSGQGLFMAHSIVTGRHNGQITFESAPNKGTTFYVRLPLSSAPNVANQKVLESQTV